MPVMPTEIRDAVSIIALAEKREDTHQKKSIASCKSGGKEKAVTAPGVQYIPYPLACQLGDSTVVQ